MYWPKVGSAWGFEIRAFFLLDGLPPTQLKQSGTYKPVHIVLYDCLILCHQERHHPIYMLSEQAAMTCDMKLDNTVKPYV